MHGLFEKMRRFASKFFVCAQLLERMLNACFKNVYLLRIRSESWVIDRRQWDGRLICFIDRIGNLLALHLFEERSKGMRRWWRRLMRAFLMLTIFGCAFFFS